ncbi:FAD-binding protein [Streptomyces sp. NPDC048305]|uniref:FAD-binding protein n=1 Tax=Streptomyces sp. NPDC048305 TaxID=3365532 RepID=UPI003724B363
MPARHTRYDSGTLPGKTVDVVVIGGGAANLNGALMLARSRRSAVVIDAGAPRNAPAPAMHGFIVLDGTPPHEIHGRNATDLTAGVGVSAAAGAPAGSHMDALLVAADTDAALAAAQAGEAPA